MKIISGLAKIKKIPKAVVTLGVFDGVHRAHQKILRYTVRQARRIKGESVAVTFWPHPQGEASLYSLKHRLRLIEDLGLDLCVVIKFSRHLSLLAAQDFVKDILIDKIGAKHICIGKNFRFGKNAGGGLKLLKRLSGQYQFGLKAFEVMKVRGLSISSTSIRRAITQGKLKTAENLLSRRVSVLGTVICGTSLAKQLGFPTANINPHHEVMPPPGVYAVKIIFRGKNFKGVCYLGSKPTFKRKTKKAKGKTLVHIEAHVFSFRQKIYGQDLEIQFIRKIRDEKEFTCARDLAGQIKKDVILAKKLFSCH